MFLNQHLSFSEFLKKYLITFSCTILDEQLHCQNIQDQTVNDCERGEQTHCTVLLYKEGSCMDCYWDVENVIRLNT